MARTVHVLPQHRNVEDVMHLSQLRRKSNPIRNITNSIKNIKGTNKTGTELPLPAKTNHSLPRRDP
ncbi:hypothetical protein Dimus_038506 [Dionaea muscipula]